MGQNIVYEALETLYDYSFRLIDGINAAVEDFREQREDKGLEILPQIIEGLQWAIEVVFRTKYVLQEYEIEIEEEEIKDLLNELLDAVENQDYVLISDLLEYEIIELLKEWQKGLQKMNFQVN
ncbi:hypothetical protein [Caloranaerobacter ferrireducens]|uniref:hypothetical protein n=1 Tax=Caloranaerobacter ferrireducens TaxID=1323370 RepID=UPI00084CECF6|nr:hypothetical protein [Caloranaerobacter ferrireducens]